MEWRSDDQSERVARSSEQSEEMQMDGSAQPELVTITATIVAGYVSNNTIASTELPALIAETHAALSRAAGRVVPQEREEAKPRIAVKKSVMPDFLICLEDGKKFKSLKRHLRTHYNLSPEEYREKWGLPPDYPMVAPNYANARSQLAKKMGLGTRRER
jgi:predicted transcriptional regulator